MTKICDKISQERLVAFADGELSAGETAEVSEHVRQCESCRVMVEALQQSLEIVKASWTQKHAEWPQWKGPAERRYHRWPTVRAAAVAAGILLLVGLGLIWQAVSERSEPASKADRVAQLKHTILREGAAAQMLAVGDLLASPPGGTDYARQRYSEITKMYQNTKYAEQAKLRLKSL